VSRRHVHHARDHVLPGVWYCDLCSGVRLSRSGHGLGDGREANCHGGGIQAAVPRQRLRRRASHNRRWSTTGYGHADTRASWEAADLTGLIVGPIRETQHTVGMRCAAVSIGRA
jgi:hypothetical protein